MAPDPDKALNALRRLAANKVCGSCPYEERMGFKDVCMKYKIFVCSDCKSAHQAFSHRCKSVTMSNWSMAEVDELRQENGGGNAVNRATIFARLPEGAKRPMKGCHPDDMKAFIQEAYNDMRWFDANGQAPTAAPEVQAACRSTSIGMIDAASSTKSATSARNSARSVSMTRRPCCNAR